MKRTFKNCIDTKILTIDEFYIMTRYKDYNQYLIIEDRYIKKKEEYRKRLYDKLNKGVT